MRIDEIRTEPTERSSRLVGRVTWEDSERPAQELYYSVDPADADVLPDDGHALLVGALLPAIWRGERRLRIGAPIDPELVEGVEAAMRLLHVWWGDAWRPIPIETDGDLQPRRDGRETGLFLSGGVDSIASLVANRRAFELGHRHAVRTTVLVNWFAGATGEKQRNLAARVPDQLATLRPLAAALDARLVLVETNVRALSDYAGDPFWSYQAHGATLASVGHALGGRLDRILLASSVAYETLDPWGSHPLLDNSFSSGSLRVVHDGAHLTRLDKVRLVGACDPCLDALMVCVRRDRGGQNCGRCEKCLRTMTELLAVGALGRSRAFPADVDPRRLGIRVEIRRDRTAAHWRELVEPLRERGRSDIADVIEHKLEDYRIASEPRSVGNAVRRGRRFVRRQADRLRRRLGRPGGRRGGPSERANRDQDRT